jgi:uncharacterized membrane protein YadS
VYGCLAIVLLPFLQAPLRLGDLAFGAWAGASVHEVAQVVATASAVGPATLASVVVKLTRVVLFAPMVAGVSLARRRRGDAPANHRSPIRPLFVAAFLAMIAVRTLGSGQPLAGAAEHGAAPVERHRQLQRAGVDAGPADPGSGSSASNLPWRQAAIQR